MADDFFNALLLLLNIMSPCSTFLSFKLWVNTYKKQVVVKCGSFKVFSIKFETRTTRLLLIFCMAFLQNITELKGIRVF